MSIETFLISDNVQFASGKNCPTIFVVVMLHCFVEKFFGLGFDPLPIHSDPKVGNGSGSLRVYVCKKCCNVPQFLGSQKSTSWKSKESLSRLFNSKSIIIFLHAVGPIHLSTFCYCVQPQYQFWKKRIKLDRPWKIFTL